MKLTDQRKIRMLTIICSLAYLVSYLTRKNFGAVISEYVVAEGVTKASASIVTVALFICYGAGQLLSGWLGDHMKPVRVVTAGLIATSLCNLTVPFIGANTRLLAVVWGLNGLAQAMLWPPMVKLLSEYLSDDDYQTACVRVSWGGSCGTIAVYIIASGFIKFLGSWRSVFVFAACLALVMAAVWQLSMSRLEGQSGAVKVIKPTAKADKGGVNLLAVSPLILIMLVIIFQGMLRDGVETWMPSYLHDVFGLDTSSSILTSVGLPVFSILSIQAASVIYRKFFKNEMLCAAVIFSAALIAALILGLLSGFNVWLSAILVVLLTGAMHGVNLIMVCYVAARYARYGNVAFISGLLNSCTYIGSALFAYGIAKLADSFDWKTTIFCWAIVAACGVVCAFASVRSWGKFTKSDE